MNTKTKNTTFDLAFKNFYENTFEDAVMHATKLDYGGEKYYVELFDDGYFKLIEGKQLGNMYQPRGMLLLVPFLKDDEYEELEEYYSIFFDNVEQEFLDIYNEKIEELSA